MISNEFHARVGSFIQHNGDIVIPSTVKTTGEQRTRIEANAEYEGKSISGYIRSAIEFYEMFALDLDKYDAFRDPRITMMRNRDVFMLMAEKMR